ncbi:MAG: alanyl-tRNA synthetase [Actinomycetota bacterium]|jgi:alanyl-tRNA synthetase
MDAKGLRAAFTGFFAERGHTILPSSGLIPHHPRAPLFTNAGMNQFLPVILGEESPPDPPRATSVQKCVRVKGKHDDIEEVGRSPWHLSFFEMLGNFSFGDYFKETAIPFAWELSTEVLGYDGDRIWPTVHTSDDDAFAIWRDVIGVPAERIQRMGDDNFWEMGETGPCGPCSELYYDMGESWGAAGGPETASPRYLEFWNLVFMQYDRQAGGALADLPMKVIDTGAGLERNLCILQGAQSVFDTDELARLVQAAARATGKTYGADERVDVTMRILADHGRTATFLVNDGVFPSNEDRGYVLRRIMRRAVRLAYQLGVDRMVLPEMVAATADVMGEDYPELRRNQEFITGIAAREEERFRQTLRAGVTRLEDELERSGGTVSGAAAFLLHDTYGFPIDLTREMAAERGVDVDLAGFEAAMGEQRQKARDARKAGGAGDDRSEQYRDLIEQFGITEFTGYQEYESKARVLAVLTGADGAVEVFLDRTPFYAEGGGQVGDTGTISTDTGMLRVLDTTAAVPGLHRHVARVEEGEVEAGQEALASVDGDRRDAIRRNHTGTHLLHWALREVLGHHVKQQGSLVAPDRLRFDFSHYEPVKPDEMARVEDLVNARVLANEPVRAYETSKSNAEQLGAIAFFGDKYGEFVRVVEAGNASRELCGGTHVGALGMIGPVKVVSEGSIGSNLRRIEAVTGTGSLDRIRDEERLLERAADLLKARPDEVPEAIARIIDRQKALDDELKAVQAKAATGDADALAADAVDGKVVARKDGLPQDGLRQLAQAVRDKGVDTVVIVGSPDGERVALVGLTVKDASPTAPDLIGPAAKIVGGGGGGKDPTQAVAGGRDASKIDEALASVRAALGLA